MKRLLTIFIALFTFSLWAADTRIEAWVSITNLPNGNTQSLTWNSALTRTWTNTPSSSVSTLIQTTNNIQNSRTNLKIQLDTYKFTNGHVVAYGTNTNDVIIYARTNEPISIAIAGLWASVRYVTNTVFASDYVFAPPKSSQSNNFLTWQWSSIATNLAKSTSAIPNVGIINSWASNFTATNFSAPGTGLNSVQIGTAAGASGSSGIAIGVSATASAPSASAYGASARATGTNATAIGASADAFETSATAVGESAEAAAPGSTALGQSTLIDSTHTNSTALGVGATTTGSNQVRIGTSAQTVSIPGSTEIFNWLNVSNVFATNINAYAGQISAVSVTNAPWITSDSNRFSTMIVSVSATITNLSAPGTGSGSLKIGSGSIASGVNSTAIGNSASATNSSSLAVGRAATANGDTSIAIGDGAITSGFGSLAVGSAAEASAYGSVAIGGGSSASHSNSIAIGFFSETTDTNQVRIGTSAEKVSIPGRLEADFSKFPNIVGSNYITGALYAQAGSYSALANGAATTNEIQLPTNSVCTLSGNSSDASIIGMKDVAGTPDTPRLVTLINATTFNLTFVHESGVETVPARRFSLPNAANFTISTNGMARFYWNASTTRWMLEGSSGGNVSATNLNLASGSLATNTASFTHVTSNLVSGQVYTNFSQRGMVTATIAMTNVLAGDVSAMSLIIDDDADGTWDFTNGPVRINGVALSAGSEQLLSLLQPGARFAYTNQSAGVSPSAAIISGSCRWSRW